MKVLGVETSCDETSAAVVRDGEEILSNVISSQIALHRPYGGVVPEIASRNHAPGMRSSAAIASQARSSLFRLLADNVPVLIAYYRALDFRCQFANRQYAQAFGRDERSIIGCTTEEVIGVGRVHEINRSRCGSGARWPAPRN